MGLPFAMNALEYSHGEPLGPDVKSAGAQVIDPSECGMPFR